MALLHRATLTPTKPELIAAWLPSQEWADGLPELRPLGGYRLDDPDGEVGMEGILLQGADDTGDTVVVHVPLTYRGAPLEGAEAHLLGTTEHSTLGTRWVYDATGDPVWRAALARTVAEGGAGRDGGCRLQPGRPGVSPEIRLWHRDGRRRRQARYRVRKGRGEEGRCQVRRACRSRRRRRPVLTPGPSRQAVDGARQFTTVGRKRRLKYIWKS